MEPKEKRMINRTASPIRWILMLVFLSVLIFSARPASAQNETPNESAEAIKYAKAFTIDEYDGYKLLTVVRPWREADREFSVSHRSERFADPERIFRRTGHSGPGRKYRRFSRDAFRLPEPFESERNPDRGRQPGIHLFRAGS